MRPSEIQEACLRNIPYLVSGKMAIPEKVMAPHSSTRAWKIPWTEEPGRLQSMGSLGVGHDWATSLSLFTFMHWRRKWQPTPVFLPGESQGRGGLVGCCLWGRTESDTTEATYQQQQNGNSNTVLDDSREWACKHPPRSPITLPWYGNLWTQQIFQKSSRNQICTYQEGPGDFSGGPMAKTLGFQRRGPGSIPGQGTGS